jgi:predicted membrane-bound spermidine synthase
MKEIAIRRSVYVATAVALVATVLWAVLILPRLTTHPQAVRDLVNRSSRVFFAMLLVATILLSASVVRIRTRGRMNSGLLYLAAILIFLHDFMAIECGEFYRDTEGLRTVSTLMLVSGGTTLVAGILAVTAGAKYRKLIMAK